MRFVMSVNGLCREYGAVRGARLACGQVITASLGGPQGLQRRPWMRWAFGRRAKAGADGRAAPVTPYGSSQAIGGTWGTRDRPVSLVNERKSWG